MYKLGKTLVICFLILKYFMKSTQTVLNKSAHRCILFFVTFCLTLYLIIIDFEFQQ